MLLDGWWTGHTLRAVADVECTPFSEDNNVGQLIENTDIKDICTKRNKAYKMDTDRDSKKVLG